LRHGRRWNTGWWALHSLAFALTLLAATLSAAQESTQAAPAKPKPPSQAPSKPPSGIEEIVVLGAESESSSDFGAGDSVTGFGAEDLAALGAKDVADLASFTPNLEIVTAGATTPTFFIRGVGLNDFNPTSTGSVAIYRDDVPINAPALQLESLFDVEAVNILRGPQGTGLARNASAGAIKVYSRKPTGEYGGYLRSDFGNFDYRDFEGAVEAPIYQDLLSGRLAFRLTQRDGTMKNRCGIAPPSFLRVPYPGAVGGAQATQAPWSICGEPVDQGKLSPLPTGLPDIEDADLKHMFYNRGATSLLPDVQNSGPIPESHVNNFNNWAARGTLLFQPTLDQTWTLSAHGSRRDELSRLGQSIGTGDNYCINGPICDGVALNRVPPLLLGDKVFGLLGGPENGMSAAGTGNLYVPREIQQRYAELLPCLADNSCSRTKYGQRVATNLVKVKVANELASGLDSQPWVGDFNRTGPTKNDTGGFYLKGDVNLPWGIEFKSTSAFDGYDRLVDIDLDFSPLTLFQIITHDKAYQLYQDFSLGGQIAEYPFHWEIGGWGLREDLTAIVHNDFGKQQFAGVSGRDYNQRLWSAGGYGTFSWDFWDKFTLDGGVRYNWEQKDLDMLITSGSGSVSFIPEGCDRDSTYGPDNEKVRCILNKTWQAPTGTLRLTYRFREDTSVFAKYTRGWKPGTFNATASNFTGPTIAEPEQIDSFETGLHGSWFDGRAGLDTQIFYYAYENYQIFTARQFLGGSPEFVVLNAKNAEVYGAELDATSRPWPGAFLEARVSWLESQFLDFVQSDQLLSTGNAGFQIIFLERQNSGHPLLNSPRFKVSLTGEQTVPLGRYGSLTLRYDGVWTDTTYYDATMGRGIPNQQRQQFLPANTIAQVPFWLHNVKVSWRSPNGRFEISGWARNLENKAYKTYAFDASNFRRTTIYFVGDPRTFGVTALINF
jgi:outer membrane receptor protein involved in Fe transport